MFETAELGRRVTKPAFQEAERRLHPGLLAAQRELRDRNFPVFIVLAGVEGAGKGELVNLLNKWLDARGVETHAFWEDSDEERERPAYWRYWRALPKRGKVGILLGSWYTRPIRERVEGRSDAVAFHRDLRRIVEFERLLAHDGALILKFWFHLGKKDQARRKEREAERGTATPELLAQAKDYPAYLEAAERAIRSTDLGFAPWHVVESRDQRYRDLTVGQILLDALERRLKVKEGEPLRPEPPPPPPKPVHEGPRTILDQLDLSRTISRPAYARELKALQEKLRALTWRAKARKRNTVLLFEGWDASGKGGAIRRVTAGIDARLLHIHSVAAPTDEEKAHHYLWRFWRHIPRAGYVTIYDRSWYGRVLVERVEGFARGEEWRRAYGEINDFEEQLVEHGVVLAKFWLQISPEEQLRRFREREATEWKQHKITEEDWRNREKWELYEAAVHDMVDRTSSTHAPWSLIAANDKRLARLEVLRTVCRRLEAEL